MSAHPPIHASIEAIGDQLCDLSRKLHGNPELGYEEVRACAWQVQMLRRWGFDVETPCGGADTAYRATLGSGAPVFAVLAEYDALPEIGHACGHNLICACSLGAGKAIADRLDAGAVAGTLLVIGTPAEERFGGKVRLVEEGCFEGIDAAVMAHPSSRTQAWYGSLGVTHYDVAYRGQAAHAAVFPEKGRNALDAAMLLFAGTNAWRQHLPEDTRVHGIVTDGGAAPNIVPASAACSFYIRANDADTLSAMEKRFERIAEAAAAMTDTEVTFSVGSRYKPGLPNQALNRAYHEIAEELGMSPSVPPRGGRGSTDFADVSRVVPGAHVYFAICETEVPSHSEEFAAAAATDFAHRQMLKAAEALANIGYRFFTDPMFREQVKGETPRQSGKPRSTSATAETGDRSIAE